MAPWNRVALFALAAVLTAAGFGGCGSSSRQPPTGAARSVSIADPATVASITVAVGDTIDFRMPPLAGEHRPDGRPVTWPALYTSQSLVLQAQDVPGCPASYTCQAFRALVTGSAILYSPSPSGILCGRGHGCVGVAAPAPRPIPVQIRASGAPTVNYRR